MEVIQVEKKFDLFQDQWSPKVLCSLNGQDVKIAKVEGEFVWHNHEDEDELFYIIKGTLEIHFEDGIRHLEQGDMLMIPKGVEHKPVAKEECWIMLVEPQSIKHTGDTESELTVTEYEKI